VQDAIGLCAAYPYLAWSSSGALTVGALCAVAGRQRRMMVIAGLILSGFSVLIPTFEAGYWSPTRVAGGVFGIEDVLIMFVVGSLAWTAGTWPFRRRLTFDAPPGTAARRGVILSAALMGAYLTLWHTGVDAGTAAGLVHVAVTGVLLMLRRPLWRIALSGLAGFGAAYWAWFNLFAWLFPRFGAQWGSASFWSARVGGMPLGEVVWCLTFGAAAPVCVAFVFGARFTRPAAAEGAAAAPHRGPRSAT